MKILRNQSLINNNLIQTFFTEENVLEYVYKRSRNDKLRFPWDTKAPIVYKFKDSYVKVHGLKQKYHYFMKKSRATIVDKLHKFLESKNIKTIKPNIIAVEGKYSIVGTPNIHNLGLKLLSEVDIDTQIKTLDKIFNDLFNLGLYHYDNKPENAVIDSNGDYILLDIDSVRKPTLLRNPKWKLKKRSKTYHLKRINKLKLQLIQ